jgi:glycosyltransferase involved in cell wall biosynthesis
MMTRGRAVVASKVGGIPELIEDGVSGLLFPPGDVDALAERLQRVMTSPELERKLGAGAKARARSFTMDQQISEMIETFADVFDTTQH